MVDQRVRMREGWKLSRTEWDGWRKYMGVYDTQSDALEAAARRSGKHPHQFQMVRVHGDGEGWWQDSADRPLEVRTFQRHGEMCAIVGYDPNNVTDETITAAMARFDTEED